MADTFIAPEPEEPQEIPQQDRAALESLIDEVVPEGGEAPETPEEPQGAPEPEKTPPEPSTEPEKAPEEPETKPEPTLKDAPPAKAKSDEELDEELKAYEAPKNAHPNVKKAIPALKARVKEELAARRAAEQAAETARQEAETLKKAPLPENVSKELEELRQFRRIKDIESDPTFQSKYNEPIQKKNAEIVGTMKDWGLSEKVEKFITDNGGVAAMRYSTAMMPDGKTTRAQWFKEQILENLEDFQKEDLEESLREVRRLEKEKAKEMEEAKADSGKWEQQRTAAQEQQQKEIEARATRIRDQMLEKLGPQAQKWTPKPDATPDEIEYAKWHNETLEKSAKAYGEFVGNFEPEVEVPKAILASQALYLGELTQRQHKQIEDLRTKLKEAETKLGKISASGRTAKQSNAPVNHRTSAPSVLGDDRKGLESIMNEVLGRE